MWQFIAINLHPGFIIEGADKDEKEDGDDDEGTIEDVGEEDQRQLNRQAVFLVYHAGIFSVDGIQRLQHA